ncbi:MAG: isochorismatase family protein [Chloroflexi bacterium]|nr:isochorismatase family protein [Chloroflexota bacterium]
MPAWDDLLDALPGNNDREVYARAGYGKRVGFGERPALVIIDVTYSFVGDRPEPILESIKRFPNSCGEAGWRAIEHISSLLPLAREKGIPVIYSREPQKPHSLLRKWDNTRGYSPEHTGQGAEIVGQIAPMPDDIIIYKDAPSIFFGTTLPSLLIPLRVDTLLVCGGVTSGCVRASVVDAATYGFRVAVIEECTFDRAEVSHKSSLFDMDAKYADVVSQAEVRKYLGGLTGSQGTRSAPDPR